MNSLKRKFKVKNFKFTIVTYNLMWNLIFKKKSVLITSKNLLQLFQLKIYLLLF